MAAGMLARHRPALVLCTGASSALFGWAAWELPSRPGSVAASLLALLALAHLGTLLLVLLRPEQLRPIWRALSWLSLGAGAVLTLLLAVTAREMVLRFGSLGMGVASLLAAITVLVLLATVPFAAWGLRATRRAHGPG